MNGKRQALSKNRDDGACMCRCLFSVGDSRVEVHLGGVRSQQGRFKIFTVYVTLDF